MTPTGRRPAAMALYLSDRSGVENRSMRAADAPADAIPSPATSAEEELREIVSLLTRELDLGNATELTRLEGGRNNRVYRVVAGNRPMLLKQYYRDAGDPRDRLAADFGFSRQAWHSGVRAIAEPLLADPLLGLALYGFLEGRRLREGEPDEVHVDQAFDLVVAVNRQRLAPEARALPFAAEAVFCIADHLAAIEARLQRLARIQPRDVLDERALQLVREELQPRFAQAERDCGSLVEERNLTGAQRILSPSDFGFHNALIDASGRLFFFDFEYAGWDDPAKLVCDFFCQVEVPVPIALLPRVVERVIRDLGVEERQRQRIAALLPLFRLKWACILLNEFLPAAAPRRQFAGATTDLRDQQLEKAARLFDGLR